MLILINLDAATQRRAFMTQQLAAAGLEFERTGVDMRGCSAGEIAAWLDIHLPNLSFDLDRLSGAEVGCWTSHLSAWQRLIADQGARRCTVIEDDLVLHGDFAEALKALAKPCALDIVYLGTSSRNLSTRRRLRIGRFWAHAPVGAVYNTWGYSIGREFAQRFFARMPLRIDVPIDHFLGRASAKAEPRIGVLRPAVIAEHPGLGAQSQIGPHTRRFDRWQPVETARRRLLSSRVGDFYYALFRLL